MIYQEFVPVTDEIKGGFVQFLWYIFYICEKCSIPTLVCLFLQFFTIPYLPLGKYEVNFYRFGILKLVVPAIVVLTTVFYLPGE